MNKTLLGLSPTLSVDLPAVDALISTLNPGQVIHLEDLHRAEISLPQNEITHVILCADPGGGAHIRRWLKEDRSRLVRLQSVAFVEIADEDSPDSWLLDEQGWLDVPQSPILATRVAAGDAAAALDFALALKTSGYPAVHIVPEINLDSSGENHYVKTHGDQR